MVSINARNGPYSRVKRWAVGPYEHIFLYMGMVRLFDGRGFQEQRYTVRMSRGLLQDSEMDIDN